MTGHHPTMTCPGCGRRIAVSTANLLFPHNSDPGNRCAGSHQSGTGLKTWPWEQPAQNQPAQESA